MGAGSPIGAAVRMLVVMTVLLGLAYPLAATAAAQLLVEDRAGGSLVIVDGAPVGSALIAQPFVGVEYFHPRPSAASYDALASTGSNLGPPNPDLRRSVGDRVERYRSENGLSSDADVPVDAVTASGSGLDPHISPANAQLQAARVAAARSVEVEVVLALVDDHTGGRPFGVLGDETVNVLELNVALDEATGRP